MDGRPDVPPTTLLWRKKDQQPQNWVICHGVWARGAQCAMAAVSPVSASQRPTRPTCQRYVYSIHLLYCTVTVHDDDDDDDQHHHTAPIRILNQN